MKVWEDKLAEIYSGWINWLWKTPEIEILAKARAIHCAKCDSNIANVCKECGCPLIAKIRSTKETNICLLNKWEK